MQAAQAGVFANQRIDKGAAGFALIGSFAVMQRNRAGLAF